MLNAAVLNLTVHSGSRGYLRGYSMISNDMGIVITTMINGFPNQSPGSGYRALAGCLTRFVLTVIFAGLVLGYTVRHTKSPIVRPSVWFGMMGLLLGTATSILADSARRTAAIAFVVIGVMISLLVFAERTLFGRSDDFPLLISLTPLMLPVGFIIGQLAWNMRK